MRGQRLEIVDRVFLGLMRAFQPLNCLQSDFLDQPWSIAQQVPGLAHVAIPVALEMHIQRLKAELWRCRGRPVMPCAVLDISRCSATDTGMPRIALAYPGVESGLSVLEVIRPALQLLLSNLDLPALALGQRLALPLLPLAEDRYRAVGRTPCLKWRARDE